VDLHLLARRGLEADRRTAARFKLLTEPSARALDRAQARVDPEFLAQLLAHHVAVAPVLQEPLPQPTLLTAQHAVALRLAVGHRPARVQIAPHRVARDAQRPRDPLRTPP